MRRRTHFHVERSRLVSDGESDRKAKLGQTNAATQDLVHRAHVLLHGLVGTFVAVLCFLGLGGLLYTRFHRQRERAGETRFALNHELRRYAQVVRSTDNLVVVTDAQPDDGRHRGPVEPP